MNDQIKQKIEKAADEHISLMKPILTKHQKRCAIIDFTAGATHVIESPELYGLVAIDKVRTAFANYFSSEGCSCCRGDDHKDHEEKLSELLHPEKYEDGSGNDWYKYKSEGGK